MWYSAVLFSDTCGTRVIWIASRFLYLLVMVVMSGYLSHLFRSVAGLVPLMATDVQQNFFAPSFVDDHGLFDT